MLQRFLLAFALLFTVTLQLAAQPGTWAIRFGGTSQDIPEDVVVDAAGNAYVVGTFSDTLRAGGLELVSKGLSDAFLIKFDPTGAALWAMSYGTAGRPEYGRELDWAADGSLLVAGEFEDTLVIGTDTLFNGWSIANAEIFVMCVDVNGNFRWGVPVGHRGGDFIGGLEAAPNGDFYTSGLFRVDFAILDFDATDTVVATGGIDDVFLLRKDSTDNHHWITAGKSKQRDVAHDMTSVGDTVLYVTGYISDSAWFADSSVLATTSGDKDIFLARYDTSGALSWVASHGGLFDDFGNSLTSDPAGNIYLAGTFDSSMTFMGSNVLSAGKMDAYVAKISPAGSLVWIKTFGGPAFDGIKHVRYNNSKLVITGFYQGDAAFGSDTLRSSDEFDQNLFVAALDNAGDVIWATGCGGVNFEQGNAVEVTGDGHVYAVGSFLGTGIFGQTKYDSYGSDDAILLRLDSQGRVEVDASQASMPLSVFPNPAKDHVMIDLTLASSAEVSLSLLDLQGRAVQVVASANRWSEGNHVLEVGTAHLPNGMYLVSVTAGDHREVRKLIIQR
jgi:hypothetical protein